MAREPSICERIAKCKKDGALNTSQMALWLGRPGITVRSWLRWEREPADTFRPEIDRRLKILERMIRDKPKNKTGIIPYELSSHKRAQYLKDLFHATEAKRISRQNTAG